MNFIRNDSVFIDSNNYIGEILPKLEGNDVYANSVNVSVDNIALNKGNYNIKNKDEDLLISDNNINTNEKKDKNNGQNYQFEKKPDEDDLKNAIFIFSSEFFFFWKYQIFTIYNF